MRKTIFMAVAVFSLLIFSCKKEEDTLNLPTVVTGNVFDINFTSVNVDGDVTKEGGSAVTQKGAVYSTSPNPTYVESPPNYVNNGAGTGKFTSAVSSLQKGTMYYVRSYAINAEGVGYGEQKSFTTKQ